MPEWRLSGERKTSERNWKGGKKRPRKRKGGNTSDETFDTSGYYCPYEDNCPFDDEDFEDCEKYKGKTAIFEDTVGDITVGEDGIWIRTENCGVCSQVGLYIFLIKEEAEAALKKYKH